MTGDLFGSTLRVSVTTLPHTSLLTENDLLYSFSPQATFGDQFTIAPNQLIFINIQEGQYNKFAVEFADQNNKPVAIEDPNFVVLLIISEADEI